MTALRVVIVDDEPLARRGIRQLLAPYGDIEVAAEARNGREAVRVLKTVTPDLVFLDVQMPELDGFGVLSQIDQRHLPAVIFVTAYDTFAVRAFDAYAVDYLVKPVHEDRFREALGRARERLRSKDAGWSERVRDLVDAASQGLDRSPPPRRLLIGTAGSDLMLDIREIQWIEADDYYAAVHAGGRRHLVRESLASLEARLDPAEFVRVHRSAIVNLAHVREVRTPALADAVVVLRDGTELPLSRRRRERVAQAIRRYAG